MSQTRRRVPARVTRLILEKADEGARRLGIDRREFLASSMGMATSLWAINMVNGCGGNDDRPGRAGDLDPDRGTMDDAGSRSERDAAMDQLSRDGGRSTQATARDGGPYGHSDFAGRPQYAFREPWGRTGQRPRQRGVQDAGSEATRRGAYFAGVARQKHDTKYTKLTSRIACRMFAL